MVPLLNITPAVIVVGFTHHDSLIPLVETCGRSKEYPSTSPQTYKNSCEGRGSSKSLAKEHRQQVGKKNRSCNKLNLGTASPVPTQVRQAPAHVPVPAQREKNSSFTANDPILMPALVPVVLRLDVRGLGLPEALQKRTLKAPRHLHHRLSSNLRCLRRVHGKHEEHLQPGAKEHSTDGKLVSLLCIRARPLARRRASAMGER